MKVNLKLIANNLNLPTVIKTATLPGEIAEKLFIATQTGEIFYVENNNLKWTDRKNSYDHVDTIEEWILNSNKLPQKKRTLLNLRRPFSNHNGVNTLNFSPETGNLVLTTGDGGSGYDPFNLSQDDLEIPGKIIEIDIKSNLFEENPEAITRFDEIPVELRDTFTIIAKGVRNISGISYQKFNNAYIKHIGNVGQDLVESIFSFIRYKPLTVTELIKEKSNNIVIEKEGFINFGWREWEGSLPTLIIKSCPSNTNFNEKTVAYYNEITKTVDLYLKPVINYFHENKDGFAGTAITGVQSYMGNTIPELTNSIVFIDLARKNNPQNTVKGALCYSKITTNGKPISFNIIGTNYDFGSNPAYFTSLGTNSNQTKLFLGVSNSMKVTDANKGSIFEIIP